MKNKEEKEMKKVLAFLLTAVMAFGWLVAGSLLRQLIPRRQQEQKAKRRRQKEARIFMY